MAADAASTTVKVARRISDSCNISRSNSSISRGTSDGSLRISRNNSSISRGTSESKPRVSSGTSNISKRGRNSSTIGISCDNRCFLVSVVVDCQPSDSKFNLPLGLDFRVRGPPCQERGEEDSGDRNPASSTMLRNNSTRTTSATATRLSSEKVWLQTWCACSKLGLWSKLSPISRIF